MSRVSVDVAEPVRWVFSTRFGSIGVSGLCHGGGPFVTTVVALLPTESPLKWNTKLIARIDGCPAVVQLNPERTALVIALAEGEGLVRADATGKASVGMWPRDYHPTELHVVEMSEAGPVPTFYVGFRHSVVAFYGEKQHWFALRECVHEADSGGGEN